LKQLEYHFESLIRGQLPLNLYEPVHYVLTQGGKRIRPYLVMLANELFGGDPETILYPAAAFEMLHNFTLIHDDIMDNAPIRRGKPTVYKKWNSSIAILAGDALATMAFQELLKTPCSSEILIEMCRLFARTSVEICEGQQYDLDFEMADCVSREAYLDMIRLKTAVMLAGCLKTGALHAGAAAVDCSRIYDFGINLGIAFQLQDDILDVYGDKALFGKICGGDINDNKKTYLYIVALEKADEVQKAQLQHYFGSTDFDFQEKFDAVKAIFDALEMKREIEQVMQNYVDKAIAQLGRIHSDSPAKETLRNLTLKLCNRDQ
jgi:geranylgeranyl diphosphate synthase type II